jgi:hypothetical protein
MQICDFGPFKFGLDLGFHHPSITINVNKGLELALKQIKRPRLDDKFAVKRAVKRVIKKPSLNEQFAVQFAVKTPRLDDKFAVKQPMLDEQFAIKNPWLDDKCVIKPPMLDKKFVSKCSICNTLVYNLYEDNTPLVCFRPWCRKQADIRRHFPCKSGPLCQNNTCAYKHVSTKEEPSAYKPASTHESDHKRSSYKPASTHESYQKRSSYKPVSTHESYQKRSSYKSRSITEEPGAYKPRSTHSYQKIL